jgi:putative membrane protein
MDAIVTSLSTFPSFAAYFAEGALVMAAFGIVYCYLTPYNEIQLIKSGNVAAAIAFSGAMVGFVIPLASVIAHSGGRLDVVMWGAVAMVVQLGGFAVARWIFRDLSSAVPEGRVSEAVFLAGLSVALGILNAACMAG